MSNNTTVNTSSLKMLTREEVAELLQINKVSVTMLSEVGVLKPIRLGKRFMYSQEQLQRMQRDYAGMDLSNKFQAIQSMKEVERRQEHDK